MELTEDQVIEKYAKHQTDCSQKMLLPYEYERICLSCGYNVIKRKHELTKNQRKKNFITRLKYAEHKKLCMCIEVYKFYESINYDKI